QQSHPHAPVTLRRYRRGTYLSLAETSAVASLPSSSTLSSPLCALHHPRNRRRHLFPLSGLNFQLLAAFSRQPVKLRTPVIFGHAPFRLHPSALFHPVQRRI